MDYGGLSLKTLRDLCRKKGAKTTGKKAHLVERLHAYDRNNQQQDEAPAKEDSFEMELPPKDSYKDINSDSALPHVSQRMVDAYLNAAGDTVRQSHRDLYFMRYLRFARLSTAALPKTFVHAHVQASKKKNVNYFVDIALLSDGAIREAQCECAVGAGPLAHCKHVVITLLGLIDHSNKTPIMTYLSCTQKLQTFHSARPHTGSPVKAKDLPLGSKGNKSNFSRDPRPPEVRGNPQYPAYFRNIVMSGKDASLMPIFQAYEPANIRAVAADHTYCSVSMEEQFLRKEGLADLSAEERQRIEESTRAQSRSSRWMTERGMRLTASNFGRICKVKDKDSLAASLIAPTDISHVPAVVHGRQFEGAALQKLESTIGGKVIESGLQVHPFYPYLAASPDGLVQEEDGLCVVEAKCPFAAKDSAISPENVPYLEEIDTGLMLKEKHNYYYQVQAQMACTGAQKCYFVVFTHADCKVILVPRNESFICSMTEQLKMFFESHFKPLLIKKFLYKE